MELSDYEKERGKPLPSYNHCFAQTRLVGAFAPSKEYLICSELTLELSDGRCLTPDLSVYSTMPIDWRHDIIRMKVMPLLAVEILSMGQDAPEAEAKIALYFANGAKSAWLVQPAARAIAIYLPNTPGSQVFTTGEAKDPITGLTARLEEIFA